MTEEVEVKRVAKVTKEELFKFLGWKDIIPIESPITIIIDNDSFDSLPIVVVTVTYAQKQT